MEGNLGVNESAPPAENQAVNQDVSADSSTEQSAAPQEENWDDVPFGKHPRFQALLDRNRKQTEELKSYTQRVQEYEQQNNKYKQELEGLYGHDAVKLWNLLAENPEKYNAVLQVLGEVKKQEDPYAGKFDDVVAQKFREVDALKNQLEEKERLAKQEEYTRAVNQNIETNTELFKKMCSDEKISNEKHQEALVALMMTDLMAELGTNNVVHATAEQVQNSFRKVLPTLNAIRMAERQSLSQNPNVPASGSRTGVPPRQTGFSNDRERIAHLVNLL